MSAAAEVMSAAGADIIGGHSAAGAELSIGFTVTGLVTDRAIGLTGAQAGDALILTKPIGTGVLLAAEMQGLAKGGDIARLYQGLTTPQAAVADILAPHARAMTDVTGFGLLGHLNEMLEASTGVGVQLQAEQVPALAGSLELLGAGVASTLAPSNAAALALWPELLGTRAQLLIDPQTCGPLLAAVPEQQAGPCLAAMRSADFSQAARIGTVQNKGPL